MGDHEVAALGSFRAHDARAAEAFGVRQRGLDVRHLVQLTFVIALENLRGRFNAALGVEAAGFSEGTVCAVPEDR
ncbi:MAG TPA: hypothetical protein VGG05_18575 [Pseudonocardiaceae bacterium]